MSTSATAVHPHGGARTYGKVLAALLTLTALTVFAASLDFGSMNVVIALVIATAKASLVALFFMHLKDDKPINSIILVGGLFALTTFLALSFMDTDTRTSPRPLRMPPAAAAPASKTPSPAAPQR